MKGLMGLFIILMLMGCGSDGNVTVSGGTDNTVTVDNVKTELKQVDGILFIRTSSLGETLECIAVDSGNLYPSEWSGLTKADESRESNYTMSEYLICTGEL